MTPAPQNRPKMFVIINLNPVVNFEGFPRFNIYLLFSHDIGNFPDFKFFVNIYYGTRLATLVDEGRTFLSDPLLIKRGHILIIVKINRYPLRKRLRAG